MRELVEWYREWSNSRGDYETHMELQRAVCSSQLTAKLIAMVVLTGQGLGYNINLNWYYLHQLSIYKLYIYRKLVWSFRLRMEIT